MKFLDLFLNGHPPKLDNLIHMQTAYTEAFKAIVDGLAISDSDQVGFKLAGCEVTTTTTTFPGDTATWTSGWLVRHGEILEVDAGGPIVRNINAIFRWAIVESSAGPDPQTYADGSTPEVHKVRKAVLIADGILSSNPLHNVPHLKEVIHPSFATQATIAGYWSAEHDLGGAVVWNTSSSLYKFRQSRNQLDVNISISISSLSAAATQLEILLPSNRVANGAYSGVAWINGQACLAASFDGQNYIRIFGTFPVGSLSGNIRFQLEVQ